MKKLMIRIVVVLGILADLLLIASLLFLFKFQSETKKMSPLPTGKVIDGIYAINNTFVNCYLMEKGDHMIAIDAGTDLKATGAEMKKLNLNPEKVVAVFLTHTDSDHVAAIELFKNARVYISRDEEQMVNGKTHRQLIFNNTLNHKHELLSDNDVINIDNLKVQAISTPGHTPGSMSYLVDDQDLFSGDLLSLQHGKAKIFNRFFNMDTQTEERSIKKIKNYSNVKYIITAHYGYTADPAGALRAW
jgi:glyoxylase-like metal-dependent hydrolase (beta-lactamase superfamily II)